MITSLQLSPGVHSAQRRSTVAWFEMSFFEHADIALGEVHCTLQACRLTLGEKLTSLPDAAEAYLDVTLDKTEQTGNWGVAHLSKEQLTYAALDAVVEWLVAERVFPALRDQAPAYEIQIGAVGAGGRPGNEPRRHSLDERDAAPLAAVAALWLPRNALDQPLAPRQANVRA